MPKDAAKFNLDVSYSLSDYEWGALDEKIEKAAKCELGGAGTGFGARDLSFYFSTRKKAEAAQSRIEKLGLKLSYSIDEID